MIFYYMGHTRDGTLKTTLQNFHIIFLNSDISVNVYSIIAKSLENNVHCLPKGGMSQNVGLGPCCSLCCVEFGKNTYSLLFMFCIIKT